MGGLKFFEDLFNALHSEGAIQYFWIKVGGKDRLKTKPLKELLNITSTKTFSHNEKD